MNKEELVAHIAWKHETTIRSARHVLNAALDAITTALSETGEASIRNFGLFSVVQQKGVPTVKFSPSARLKRGIKQGVVNE